MAALLIGRYQPLHDGHVALVREALRRYGRVVVGLRDTPVGPDNPFSIAERMEMFCQRFGQEMASGHLSVIDLGADITHVVHGRKVGWWVVRIDLPEAVEAISATAIRQGGINPCA